MLDPSSHHAAEASESQDRWEAINFASRPVKDQPQSNFIFRSWNSMEARIGCERKGQEESESGVCSPPLWRTSPERSPHRTHYRSLSPTSRIQAIARGQRELMEMVRNMPESCYELSLKDLVEHPAVVQARQGERENWSSDGLYRRESSKKKGENRAGARRSRSMESGGFYLKMVFPISLGSTTTKRKIKKSDSGLNSSSKVSPKPPVADGTARATEKDWWKKRITVSGESESGVPSMFSGSIRSSGSSSSGSGSGRIASRRVSSGCWPCISSKD